MFYSLTRGLMICLAATMPASAKAQAQTEYVRIFISPAGEPFRASSGDYPSRAWFDLADANHDGHLTASEMMSQARAFFGTIDLDKNGRLDGEEIRNYEVTIAPETRTLNTTSIGDVALADDYVSSLGGIAGNSAPPPQPERRPEKLRELPRGAGRFSFFNFAEPIMRADTDLSGSVTLDEFETLQQLQFKTLDAKHRGYLEFQDLPRTPAQDMRLKIGK